MGMSYITGTFKYGLTRGSSNFSLLSELVSVSKLYKFSVYVTFKLHILTWTDIFLTK